MRGLSHSSSVLQDVPLLSPDDADLRACFDDFRQTMRRTLVGPWEAMLPKVLEPLDSLGTRWVQMKAEMRSGIKNEVPEQEHAERTRRQASEIDAASAEVERQRLRVRDAEVRLHQVEANLRDAQAHARRVEHELAGRTEERDKAVESKKQGLEQMVGRLRDAEGRTEALRTEKQALVAELDQLKKEHVEEVGREKAKATKLRKQAAEETMRVNDLEKQLKAARDTDGPKNEIKATSLRVEGRIRELEREIEILVGAVSEAARQRDLAVKDATAAKARLDESAGELQAARNMASRLEITRQRQAEDIEVLRASAKEHAAKHDGFVARTMADRATFFGEKKKLTVKVAELEAALAATKNAASAGQSAEAMRLGSEIDKLRVELEQMRGQAEDARKEVEVQKQAAKEANEKVVEEQVQAATAWTTVQKIIAENGRSASEREIRVSQGKKDAEATVRAKEKELEVMRKDLSNAKTLAGALAAEQDQLRSEFEVQLNEERAKVEAIGQKLAMLEQSTGQAASRDADAEQKIKAASSRAKRAQAERDVAVEEVAKLRSELDDLRSRAKTGGTGAEHLPTPRSAATEDDVSMRDDYDTTVFSIGESTAADPTLIGDPDALCDEVGIDPGSVDDAAPKTLASQIKARDREIAVLRKKLEKVEGLEEEIVQNRKMAGKWSRRVDNSLAVIKILETKVKELEKERAAKWKKGTNPVYLEMTVPQELARARMMLRTMRNEVLPKCSCAIGMEDQRLNLADSRDRVEIVLETRSTGQYPLWKGRLCPVSSDVEKC
jgi:chromosome segregation ATPase